MLLWIYLFIFIFCALFFRSGDEFWISNHVDRWSPAFGWRKKKQKTTTFLQGLHPSPLLPSWRHCTKRAACSGTAVNISTLTARTEECAERGGEKVKRSRFFWIQLENYRARTARHAPNGGHFNVFAARTPSPPLASSLRSRGDRIGPEPRMELPAAGEHVFAVEGIEKKRIRKVTAGGKRRVHGVEMLHLLECEPNPIFFSLLTPPSQGKIEYLVKWRGWSPK